MRTKQRPLNFGEVKSALRRYPSNTLRFRALDSNHVELISVACHGTVTVLGFIQLAEPPLLSDEFLNLDRKRESRNA